MLNDDDLTSAYLLGAYSASKEWKDAAEFEIRCREYLFGKDIEDAPCAHGMMIFCPAPAYIRHNPGLKGGCLEWCLLREARLKVEEEMDG